MAERGGDFNDWTIVWGQTAPWRSCRPQHAPRTTNAMHTFRITSVGFASTPRTRTASSSCRGRHAPSLCGGQIVHRL
eukprot:scaffold291_cov332-Pavlova_lutheri.AAC.6